MALNTVILMGRICNELELRQTQSGTPVLSFTVAVDRFVKDGEKQTDFISCVAWNKTAEFIAKYFGKGRMIAVTGSLRTRTYDDKNGTKHYVTEVWVSGADFTGEAKPAENANNGAYSGGTTQGYNYAPPQQNSPQTGAQSTQAATPNGYPSPYMYAPPADKSAPDTSADFGDFEVFSEDGVPF